MREVLKRRHVMREDTDTLECYARGRINFCASLRIVETLCVGVLDAEVLCAMPDLVMREPPKS